MPSAASRLVVILAMSKDHAALVRRLLEHRMNLRCRRAVAAPGRYNLKMVLSHSSLPMFEPRGSILLDQHITQMSACGRLAPPR